MFEPLEDRARMVPKLADFGLARQNVGTKGLSHLLWDAALLRA